MNDVLRFSCPSCHAQLAADTGRASQTAPCPDCGQLLILPGGKVPSGQKVLRVKPAKPLYMPPANPADPQPAVPPSFPLTHTPVEAAAVPDMVAELDSRKSAAAAESVQVEKPVPESGPETEPEIIKMNEEVGMNPDAMSGTSTGFTAASAIAPGLGRCEAAGEGDGEENPASTSLGITAENPEAETTAKPPVAKPSSPSGGKKKPLAAVLLLALAGAGTGIYLNRAALLASISPGPPIPAKSTSANAAGGSLATTKQSDDGPAKSGGTKESANVAGTGTTSGEASGSRNMVNPPPSPPVAPQAPPEFSGSAASGQPSSPPAATGVPPVALAPAAVPKTPLGRARLVLDSFLAAPDWQKRLEFSLNPEAIRDSMAAHFRDHPDGPIPVAGVSLMANDTVPGTTKSLFGFRVRVRDFRSDIPMAVEETDSGFRVDWPPFLETYEQIGRAHV